MVFQVARTFANPASSQSGFATPGDGAQTRAPPSPPPPPEVPRIPVAPTKGIRSWLFPTRPADAATGFPEPGDAGQLRPPGTRPNVPPMFGGVYQNYTPYYDRGAAAYVPNFGKVLTNPIGAGIAVSNRPQAFYGPAAQYMAGAIWWSSQVIPTTINPQGLNSPEELAALLDGVTIQAVVRTTG